MGFESQLQTEPLTLFLNVINFNRLFLIYFKYEFGILLSLHNIKFSNIKCGNFLLVKIKLPKIEKINI